MDIHEFEGLTADQVKEKRKQFGYNELPDREKRSVVKIIVGILTEPMIFLLIAVVVVYFLLGDASESVILMASVVVVVVIGLLQELRTEKALDALRNLSSPTCTVLRDGERVTIPSRELVPGDIVSVAEGVRIPADGKILSAQNLSTDESLLTGESLPVDKTIVDDESDTRSRVFSSSMVVQGHGVMEVVATGLGTEVGKIGDSLNKIQPEKTLLNREVDRVVKIIAAVAISGAILITLVFWLVRGDLVHGFLAGLTLSIAILPEEFPVVLTVFMALGAWRLAKSHVLTRKSSAIETLGSASVLCTDKTGTLTENRMTVMSVTDEHGDVLEADNTQYVEVVSFGVLASQVDPFDPMEEAFLTKAQEVKGELASIYAGNSIIKEYSLSAESLSVVHVWGDAQKKPQIVALKGAPEAVFQLCNIPKEQTEQLQEKVAGFAKEGLRVLAVASGKPLSDIPEQRQGFDYTFLGLVALADPIRKEAASAIKLCQEAGIRVIMITGDYQETARRIGKEIGLDANKVLTGDEFAAMSQDEQDEAIRTTSIFSRVVPTHKLAIVESLKRNKEVVAMTGDGVNDAPALKSAHIGIAMGNRGTDVAREAASIVLLDDNFASIVQGIRLGRRIFANLSKAMAYILTVHVPIIIMSLLPVLLGWPLVLLPVHIVFLEFIIDPSCTLIFEGESEEPGAMKKPPRKLGTALFNKEVLIGSLLEGLIMSAVIFVTQYLTMLSDWTYDKSRAMTFLLIVLMNISIIVVLSGRRAFADAFKNHGKSPLTIILFIVIVVLAFVYTSPQTLELFKFDALSFIEVGLGALLALVTAFALLPVKKLFAK